MALYLYNNCSVPRALERLFEKWKGNNDFQQKRQALRELIKNKQEKKKKGQAVSKNKSPQQKAAEAALEPLLQEQRFALSCFLRRCWDEMSQTGTLYKESDKHGKKLTCVILHSSADADYDGRAARIGTVGNRQGGVGSRAAVWAPHKIKLPAQQGTPKAKLLRWLKQQRPALFEDTDLLGKRSNPVISDDELDGSDEDESITGDIYQIKKKFQTTPLLHDSDADDVVGDGSDDDRVYFDDGMEFEDNSDLGDDESPGDMARFGNVVARVNPGSQIDEEDEEIHNLSAMEVIGDDAAADESSGMSLLDVPPSGSSPQSTSEARIAAPELVLESQPSILGLKTELSAVSMQPEATSPPREAKLPITSPSTSSLPTAGADGEIGGSRVSPLGNQQRPTSPGSAKSSTKATSKVHYLNTPLLTPSWFEFTSLWH